MGAVAGALRLVLDLVSGMRGECEHPGRMVARQPGRMDMPGSRYRGTGGGPERDVE